MNTTTNATRKRSICAVLATLLFVAMLFSALFLTGCSRKVSDFTEEEHKQRISKKLEKRLDEWTYDNGTMKYEGFDLYPVYDKNEQLSFFIADLKPFSFVFIQLFDERSVIEAELFGGKMYRYNFFENWSPYTLDPSMVSTEPDYGKIWKLDENGEKIIYRHSPYYETGNINNKKYMLSATNEDEYICAVKTDNGFVNLVSGETFNAESANEISLQATIRIAFYAGHFYDL